MRVTERIPERQSLSQVEIKSSFIIPVLNEEGFIRACVESIRNQPEIPDEIIVVDNGCVDSTVAIARELDCKVVKEEEKGIGNARNRGAQIANGDVLCFIDADGVVSPNWLKEAKGVLQDSKVNAVVGINIFSHENPAKKVWYNTYTLFAYTGLALSNLLLRKPYLAGNNMAIRKDIFWKLGGFEPVVAEDVWLSKKLWKLEEQKVIFNPKMVVNYSSRGFDETGYIRTIIYWIKSALVKRSQEEYSYKNKR